VIPTRDTGGILWGAYQPTGHILATAGADHTIRLWDVSNPTHPQALEQPLSGHTDQADWVGFSPDGHTLASSSKDGTIRLWDTSDPAHATPQEGPLTADHTGVIRTAAFSPDASTLATASDDHTIELTGLNLEQAAQRVCATTATLTPQQWRQYAPELPFNPPCTAN
jgi:WD40 repeat protein